MSSKVRHSAIFLMLVSLLVSCNMPKDLDDSAETLETDTESGEPPDQVQEIPTLEPHEIPRQDSDALPMATPTPISEEQEPGEDYPLADCETECTGISHTACVGGAWYWQSESGWIYWRGNHLVGLNAYDGSIESDGQPECSLPDLKCSEAPSHICAGKCSCRNTLTDNHISPETLQDYLDSDPDAILHIFIEKSKTWLSAYDDQGNLVMDFQVSIGDEGLTYSGDFKLGEICVQEDYCEVYTPDNYPSSGYWSLYDTGMYYKGNSIFIDTCGLSEEIEAEHCQGEDQPLFCRKEVPELPQDWHDKVYDVDCETALDEMNRLYVLENGNPYPGPFGIIWGRMLTEDGLNTHRGLHGTNENEILGLTETHGCVRGSNYDIYSLYSYILRTLEEQGHQDEISRVKIHIQDLF